MSLNVSWQPKCGSLLLILVAAIGLGKKLSSELDVHELELDEALETARGSAGLALGLSGRLEVSKFVASMDGVGAEIKGTDERETEREL